MVLRLAKEDATGVKSNNIKVKFPESDLGPGVFSTFLSSHAGFNPGQVCVCHQWSGGPSGKKLSFGMRMAQRAHHRQVQHHPQRPMGPPRHPRRRRSRHRSFPCGRIRSPALGSRTSRSQKSLKSTGRRARRRFLLPRSLKRGGGGKDHVVVHGVAGGAVGEPVRACANGGRPEAQLPLPTPQ